MRNIIVFLSLGLMGLVLVLNSCDGGASKPKKPVTGASIFKKYCVNCHGNNGSMGLNGAANLAISILTKDEAVLVITEGRKMMASYKTILSKEEISKVADHVLTLRQ